MSVFFFDKMLRPIFDTLQKKYWPQNGLRRRSGGVAPYAAT